jgi:hypothetical protein
MGAYYMKWLNYSWDFTNKLNTEFAERPMSTSHQPSFVFPRDVLTHVVSVRFVLSVRGVPGHAVLLPVPQPRRGQEARLPHQSPLHQIERPSCMSDA